MSQVQPELARLVMSLNGTLTQSSLLPQNLIWRTQLPNPLLGGERLGRVGQTG